MCPRPRRLNAANVTFALKQHFSFPIPVVLRSASEMQAIVAGNPFVAPGVRPIRCTSSSWRTRCPPHRMNCWRLQSCRASSLQPARTFFYFHLPHGVGRCKLALVPGKAKFGVVGTMRNWPPRSS